jgi:hypothetical protein
MIKKIVFLGGLAMASAFSPSAFSPSLRAPSARATCKQGATATSMVWGGKDYLIAPSILSADFAKLGQEVIRSLLLHFTQGSRLKTVSKNTHACLFMGWHTRRNGLMAMEERGRTHGAACGRFRVSMASRAGGRRGGRERY